MISRLLCLPAKRILPVNRGGILGSMLFCIAGFSILLKNFSGNIPKCFNSFIKDYKSIPDFILSNSDNVSGKPSGRYLISGTGTTDLGAIKDSHWEIFQKDETILHLLIFPGTSNKERPEMICELDFQKNIGFYKLNTPNLFPLSYPFANILYYYLAVYNQSLLLHSSCIKYKDKVMLFTAPSGTGKTTISKIFKSMGAELINDDMHFIRYQDNNFYVHNIPVYETDKPKKEKIDYLFRIYQGKENKLIQLNGINALNAIMSNCIRQDYSKTQINLLYTTGEKLIKNVPIYKLAFQKGKSVIPFIEDKLLI